MEAKTQTDRSIWRKIKPTSLFFYFYFKKIKADLQRQGWKRHETIRTFFIVKFSSEKYNYNYDAIELAKKMFKRIGWECKLQSFSSDSVHVGNTNERKMVYNYTWHVSKISTT